MPYSTMSESMAWLPHETTVCLVLAATILFSFQFLGGRHRLVHLPIVGPKAGFLGSNLVTAKKFFNTDG